MLQEPVTISSEICSHCGDSCAVNTVQYDEQSFCCNGCRIAYKILSDNDLRDYYDIDPDAGISLRSSAHTDKFNYLDDPDVIKQICNYSDDHYLSISFYIPGIHCASCVWLLENLHQIDEGVQKSSVNFLRRELDLLIDRDSTSLKNITLLLSKIGYKPEIMLEKLGATNNPANRNRSLWLKMGVAGFAFGNIMLFSFPDYLNTSESSIGNEFQIIFGALNILLALPVLFYSSIDYLRSAAAAIKQKSINLDVPISIGILALFGQSVYEILSQTGTGYMDSFTGLIFFLLIGKMIEKKTFDRLTFNRDYRSYLPLAVNLINDSGEEYSLSLDKIKPGLTLQIRDQEIIPCDCNLLSEIACIDYSFITGESEPVMAKRGESVFAGGKIMGTAAKLESCSEVENSYLTSLWNNQAFKGSEKEHEIIGFADMISPWFTYTVMGIAIVSGIWWMNEGLDKGISVFASVLIIACPCALALSTPFTLGAAMNIYSLNGFFVRTSKLIGSLATATTIVFDKTGTLSGKNDQTIDWFGQSLEEDTKVLIKTACSASIHPLSRKIAGQLTTYQAECPEHYFEEAGSGSVTTLKGQTLVIGSKQFLQTQEVTEFHDPDTDTSGSKVYVAHNNSYLGYFCIEQGLRSGVGSLLKNLSDKFSLYLLSGDNDSQEDLFLSFFKKDQLRFNSLPEEKLEFIKKLQDRDQDVIMIGDGLNDAGALMQSDFGISLSDNISSFSPACDAIVQADSLYNMDLFLKFSRSCMNIILISFGLSLVYNLTGLGFAVSGNLSPLVAAVLMPLSSVSVMIFTAISTRLSAKKMGLAVWK